MGGGHSTHYAVLSDNFFIILLITVVVIIHKKILKLNVNINGHWPWFGELRLTKSSFETSVPEKCYLSIRRHLDHSTHEHRVQSSLRMHRSCVQTGYGHIQQACDWAHPTGLSRFFWVGFIYKAFVIHLKLVTISYT